MNDFTKSEKREVRRLASEAYKIELTRELENLEEVFSSWRNGDITVFDLDDHIHQYYSGPRKDLYKSYEMQRQPEAMVARALALELLDHEQVSAEVGKKIAHLIRFFKENSRSDGTN